MSTAVLHTAEQTTIGKQVANDGRTLRRKTELSDIVRLCETQLPQESFSPAQRKAFGAIMACRTSKLGGQRFACDDCGYQRYVYHSCRHRACPKCQTQARQQWVNDRKAELLPVPYFHLVFTLPHSLNPLIGWNEKNQRALLNLLFHAASRTLLEFGESRLQGKLGVTMVLHTWTQQLQSHYHVHCVVPAGALSFDGTKWNPAGRKFLFPVHALSKVFRAKYTEGLTTLLNVDDKIDVPPHLAVDLSSPSSVDDWIRRYLISTPWVVYSQPPFGGPEKVLEYLSLYTHRTAISNERIQSCVNGNVRFLWRDRRNDNELCSSVLPAMDFLKRFASHVMPTGFMRIRHFGLLANRGKTDRLNLCRTLIGAPVKTKTTDAPQTALQWLEEVSGLNESGCPCCQATLQITTVQPTLAPPVAAVPARGSPTIIDSS